MDYENVVFMYNGIIFSHKKVKFCGISQWKDGMGEHHIKQSYTGSEDQKSLVLTRMWKADLKEMQQYYWTSVTH
jgi:hypothetical protein